MRRHLRRGKPLIGEQGRHGARDAIRWIARGHAAEAIAHQPLEVTFGQAEVAGELEAIDRMPRRELEEQLHARRRLRRRHLHIVELSAVHQVRHAVANELGAERRAGPQRHQRLERRRRHGAAFDLEADLRHRPAVEAIPHVLRPDGRDGREQTKEEEDDGTGAHRDSEDVAQAEIQRVGAIFVARQDPGHALALFVLQQDDLVLHDRLVEGA